MVSTKHFFVAMFAVTKREWLTFSRYKASFAVTLIVPFVAMIPPLMTAKAFGATPRFIEMTGVTSVMAFVAAGVLFHRSWDVAAQVFAYALRREQHRGTLERNLVTAMPRTALLIGMSLHRVVLAFAQMLVIVAGLYIFLGIGFAVDLRTFLLIVYVLVLTVVASYGWGFAVAGMVMVVKDAGFYKILIRRPLLLLCGALYTVKVLPKALRYVALALPPTYSIDCLRGLLTGSKTIFPISAEIAILTVLAVVGPAVGLFVYHRVLRYAARAGTFGNY